MSSSLVRVSILHPGLRRLYASSLAEYVQYNTDRGRKSAANRQNLLWKLPLTEVRRENSMSTDKCIPLTDFFNTHACLR
jgi:hypothetical protein